MSRAREQMTVEVDGHELRLSNLDKVLFPDTETTKHDVVTYYGDVSRRLLRGLAGRPATRIRWPDGTGSSSFMEKNVPRGTPAWVDTVTLDSPSSHRADEKVTYPVVDSVATLTWLANLAALELHVPQWRLTGSGAGRRPANPDRLVIDLDPGEGVGLAACVEVAQLVRERLVEQQLRCVPVTSGSKGLHLYAGLDGRRSSDETREMVRHLAEELENARPDLVLSSMRRADRRGKVFLDWSQNSAAKTTVAPYSLRGRGEPWCAWPRTWAELESGEIAQVGLEEARDRMGERDPLARLT